MSKPTAPTGTSAATPAPEPRWPRSWAKFDVPRREGPGRHQGSDHRGDNRGRKRKAKRGAKPKSVADALRIIKRGLVQNQYGMGYLVEFHTPAPGPLAELWTADDAVERVFQDTDAIPKFFAILPSSEHKPFLNASVDLAVAHHGVPDTVRMAALAHTRMKWGFRRPDFDDRVRTHLAHAPDAVYAAALEVAEDLRARQFELCAPLAAPDALEGHRVALSRLGVALSFLFPDHAPFVDADFDALAAVLPTLERMDRLAFDDRKPAQHMRHALHLSSAVRHADDARLLLRLENASTHQRGWGSFPERHRIARMLGGAGLPLILEAWAARTDWEEDGMLEWIASVPAPEAADVLAAALDTPEAVKAAEGFAEAWPALMLEALDRVDIPAIIAAETARPDNTRERVRMHHKSQAEAKKPKAATWKRRAKMLEVAHAALKDTIARAAPDVWAAHQAPAARVTATPATAAPQTAKRAKPPAKPKTTSQTKAKATSKSQTKATSKSQSKAKTRPPVWPRAWAAFKLPVRGGKKPGKPYPEDKARATLQKGVHACSWGMKAAVETFAEPGPLADLWTTPDDALEQVYADRGHVTRFLAALPVSAKKPVLNAAVDLLVVRQGLAGAVQAMAGAHAGLTWGARRPDMDDRLRLHLARADDEAYTAARDVAAALRDAQFEPAPGLRGEPAADPRLVPGVDLTRTGIALSFLFPAETAWAAADFDALRAALPMLGALGYAAFENGGPAVHACHALHLSAVVQTAADVDALYALHAASENGAYHTPAGAARPGLGTFKELPRMAIALGAGEAGWAALEAAWAARTDWGESTLVDWAASLPRPETAALLAGTLDTAESVASSQEFAARWPDLMLTALDAVDVGDIVAAERARPTADAIHVRLHHKRDKERDAPTAATWKRRTKMLTDAHAGLRADIKLAAPDVWAAHQTAAGGEESTAPEAGLAAQRAAKRERPRDTGAQAPQGDRGDSPLRAYLGMVESAPWRARHKVPKVKDLVALPVPTAFVMPDDVKAAWLAEDPTLAQGAEQRAKGRARLLSTPGNYTTEARLLLEPGELEPLPYMATFYPDGRCTRPYVAKFGLHTLPSLVGNLPYYAGPVGEAILHFTSPELAAHVAETYTDAGRGHAEAMAWMRAHPEAAALYALPLVFTGKAAERAVGLRVVFFLRRAGFSDVVRDVGTRMNATHQTQSILCDSTLLDMPRKFKPKTLLAVSALEPPRLKGADSPLEPAALAIAQEVVSMSTLAEAHVGLTILKSVCTPESLAAFAWSLFEAWLRAGAKSASAWVFAGLKHLGDDAVMTKLFARLRGAHKSVTNRALDMLASVDTPAARAALFDVHERTRSESVAWEVKRRIEALAARHGVSVDDLRAQSVPRCGLDADGRIVLDFGPRAFVGGFGQGLTPRVWNSTGQMLKALPSAKKSDDADKAEAAKAAWATARRLVKRVASQHTRWLERAMVRGHLWQPEAFTREVVQHPVVSRLTAALVWGVFDADAPAHSAMPHATFRVAEDGTYADMHDETFTLTGAGSGEDKGSGEGTRIGVVHPTMLDAAALAAWHTVLSDYELIPPFAQLDREVHVYDTALDVEDTLFAGAVVPTGRVLALIDQGWVRHMQDGGRTPGLRLDLGYTVPNGAEQCPAYAQLLLTPGLDVRSPHVDKTMALGGLFVSNDAHPDRRSARYPFGTVPARAWSELLRTMHALTRSA